MMFLSPITIDNAPRCIKAGGVYDAFPSGNWRTESVFPTLSPLVNSAAFGDIYANTTTENDDKWLIIPLLTTDTGEWQGELLFGVICPNYISCEISINRSGEEDYSWVKVELNGVQVFYDDANLQPLPIEITIDTSTPRPCGHIIRVTAHAEWPVDGPGGLDVGFSILDVG